MKLVTLGPVGQSRVGAMIGGEILDLARLPDRTTPHFATVADVLAGGAAALQAIERVVKTFEDAGDAARAQQALIPVERAVLLAPFPKPGVIYSVGGNYRSHVEEVNRKTGSKIVITHPIGFIKNANAVIGHGQAIRLPAGNAEMVDYEAEFSFVIGRPCHAVAESEAAGCIAGYTIVNDVSARDWNQAARRPDGSVDLSMPILGKQFPTFCPMGPAFVTKDEIADPAKIAMKLTLNGEVMQDADTSDLIFGMNALLAYLSRWFRFEPGDVITTGTPGGVGFARQPPRFLRAGDVVSITAAGMTLTNPVEAG